jgi:hypothetical protein
VNEGARQTAIAKQSAIELQRMEDKVSAHSDGSPYPSYPC